MRREAVAYFRSEVFVRCVCEASGMSERCDIPPAYKNLYKNDESLVVSRGKPNLSW